MNWLANLPISDRKCFLIHRPLTCRKLLELQRTAVLRHNYDGQTTLLTLLLRNYLHYNLHDQADKLATKIEFKEEGASSNELARYYYYLGRVKAVQLKYTEAFQLLQQSLRKAPTATANGFRASVCT